MAAPANAADCSTIKSRIATFDSQVTTLQREIQAHTSRGGFVDRTNPGAVAAYNANGQRLNAWRANLLTRGQQLSAEARQCGISDRPQSVPNGNDRTPPQRPAPPKQQPKQSTPNPTPGYARPGGLSKAARDKGITSKENSDGSRTIQAKDTGYSRYDKMTPGANGKPTKAASGTSSQLSRDMWKTGSSTRRGKRGDDPPGYKPNGNCQRGHLVGDQLGGQGNDPRNIVTLSRAANIEMRSIENRVAKYIEKGVKVSYRVRPIYGNGLNAQPTAITISAFGKGMPPIYQTVLNPPC